jgi:hypothetical protein
MRVIKKNKSNQIKINKLSEVNGKWKSKAIHEKIVLEKWFIENLPGTGKKYFYELEVAIIHYASGYTPLFQCILMALLVLVKVQILTERLGLDFFSFFPE